MGQDRSRRPDVCEEDPYRRIDRAEIDVGDDPGAVDRMLLRVEEPLPKPLASFPGLEDGNVEKGFDNPIHLRQVTAAQKAAGGENEAIRAVFGDERRVVDADPLAPAILD